MGIAALTRSCGSAPAQLPANSSFCKNTKDKNPADKNPCGIFGHPMLQLYSVFALYTTTSARQPRKLHFTHILVDPTLGDEICVMTTSNEWYRGMLQIIYVKNLFTKYQGESRVAQISWQEITRLKPLLVGVRV